MIDATKIFYFIFGAFTIAGGVIGFIKASSPASLIAGGISGALLIVAALLLKDKTQAGLILGGVVSVALAGRFLPVFLKTYAVMPAGIISVLSVIGIIVTVLAFVKK